MQQIPWDHYFMDMANVVKTRSPDRTKVGAVLVSNTDKRIISTGYNAICSDIPQEIIDWNNRDIVKHMCIHAEANCILYSQSKFEDATLYCTLSPCKDCIKLISATKIKRIVYNEKYKDFEIVSLLCSVYWKHIKLEQITNFQRAN